MHISKWITLGRISVHGTCLKLSTKFFAHYYCRVGGGESFPVWSKKYLSFQCNSIRDCTCFKSTFSVKRVLFSVLSVYCQYTFKVSYYKILAYFTYLAQAFGLQNPGIFHLFSSGVWFTKKQKTVYLKCNHQKSYIDWERIFIFNIVKGSSLNFASNIK